MSPLTTDGTNRPSSTSLMPPRRVHLAEASQAAPPRQNALLFLYFTALRVFFKVDDAKACTRAPSCP
jgi:hypothetical protein